MKKLRNHSQLKQQENSSKAVNNEIDFCSLTNFEFKREIVKMLKESREDMNSNADSLRKELENIRRSQEKLENSFAVIQTELKAIKCRMNNAEEQISDVEDKIMEITQSGQQTENQTKKHESNIRDYGIIQSGPIYPKLEFQKEKKKKWGLKIYLKKLWLKTFQI